MNTFKLQSVISCLVLFCSSLVYAQASDISIEAEISRNRVYVGDELTYQVLVRGTQNPPTPKIDFPGSTQVQFHGRSSQSYTSVEVVNGRRRTVTDQRYSYQYSITATEEGTITIPAPVIDINGKNYTGNMIQFESVLPTKSDADLVELKFDRTDVYLNESIPVECTWWIGANTSDFNLSSSQIPDSFTLLGLDSNTRGQQRVGFEIDGEQIVGTVVQDANQGNTRLVFRFSVTPTQLGDFELGPIRIVFTRRSGTGRNYRAYAESDAIEIHVKEVPTLNQPDNYNGAIGRYRVTTRASNTQVNVGDPIELTLRISGDEPMTGIRNAPDLNKDTRFTKHFKVSSDGWRESLPRNPGHREYAITIRATDDQVKEIPSIEIPSFNPSSQSYQIYASDPIPLEVNAVEEVTLSDAVISGHRQPSQPTPDPVDRVELSRAAPGLWANDSADEILSHHWLSENNHFSIARYLKEPVWIAALASGPSVFLLSMMLVAFTGTKRIDLYEARQAWKRSRSALRSGDPILAAKRYVAGVLGLNEDAVTGEDANQLPIELSVRNELRDLLVSAEGDQWNAANENHSFSVREVEHLLRTIHKQILTQKGVER